MKLEEITKRKNMKTFPRTKLGPLKLFEIIDMKKQLKANVNKQDIQLNIEIQGENQQCPGSKTEFQVVGFDQL